MTDPTWGQVYLVEAWSGEHPAPNHTRELYRGDDPWAAAYHFRDASRGKAKHGATVTVRAHPDHKPGAWYVVAKAERCRDELGLPRWLRRIAFEVDPAVAFLF